jgi:catechol 2,3-dioxygenase-like lactoylglutathione lyase family enzyme
MMETIGVRDVVALLSVFDMPEAVRFYCDVLGFAIESRSPTYAVEDGVEQFHWCMLRTGDAGLMLNTAYDEGERPAERPQRVDDRFGVWLYLACPNVDEAYERLRAAGVECKPPQSVAYGGVYRFRIVSFRDPDGHGITLQWPESTS